MSRRIALEELDAQLSRAKTRYEKWSAAKLSAAGGLKIQHIESVEEKRERLAALKQQEAQIIQDVDAVRSRVAELRVGRAQEAGRENTLHQEVESLTTAAKRDKVKLAKLQEEVDAAIEQLQRSQQDVETDRRLAREKLSGLQASLQLYETRLGLRFLLSEDISEELLAVFSSIDPADPSREFTIGVRVQPGGSFEVTTCRPALDGIQQLQLELQSSGNFGAFLQDTRRHFCRLCQ